MLLGALALWRREPPDAPDAFTHHRNSVYGSFVLGFTVLLLFEGVPVHLVVSRSHPGVAWAVTAATAYGLLWLLGDWQALRLGRTRVTSDALDLHVGARWNARIPRSAIARVARPTAADLAARKDTIRALAMKSETPTVAIELREPAIIAGAHGVPRVARLLLLAPDEPARLIAALSEAPRAAPLATGVLQH